MNRISIIIVTWNCGSFIIRFIEELMSSLRDVKEVEVLILDNASTDGTAALIRAAAVNRPQISLTCSDTNLGFSGGNNQLIRQARYARIVLLNPDVFDITPAFWAGLEQTVVEHQADVCFVKLLNADGSDQDCVGEFPSLRRALRSFGNAAKAYQIAGNVRPIEVGIMAFMYTTRRIFDEVGLLDEAYHMYLEDVDWCYRANAAGKRVLFAPQLVITHIGGGSSRSRWDDAKGQMVKYDSEGIFIRKHFSGLHRLAMLALLRLKRTRLKLRARRS